MPNKGYIAVYIIYINIYNLSNPFLCDCQKIGLINYLESNFKTWQYLFYVLAGFMFYHQIYACMDQQFRFWDKAEMKSDFWNVGTATTAST